MSIFGVKKNYYKEGNMLIIEIDGIYKIVINLEIQFKTKQYTKRTLSYIKERKKMM